MCANEPHSFKNVRKCAATLSVYKDLEHAGFLESYDTNIDVSSDRFYYIPTYVP